MRSRRFARLAVVVCVLPILAHAADPSVAVTLSADETRALCLGDAAGATPAHQQLRAVQARTRTLPTKPDGWVRVGWEWIRLARTSGDPGFYVDVDACAAEAQRLAAGYVPARELRAFVALNGHRFEDARREADAILAVEPANAVALGALSDALLELGRFDEAVGAAQRGADLKPDASAYVRASYLRWLSGDRPGAKDLVKRALAGRDRRDPEPTAWTFVEAAKIFWHEGDYGGADLVLDEALRWVPDYPPALVWRGRVGLSLGKPDRAAEDLEKAYRAQPLPEAAWLLADAHAALGDTAAADADVRRVVQAGTRGDRLTLAAFYAARNRSIDDALRLLEAERAARGGVYVEDAYAWALFRAGRLVDARAASDRALRLGTPDARLLYHGGAIRLAAGDATGRGLVKQALALNPRFDATGAAEARALLAHEPATAAP